MEVKIIEHTKLSNACKAGRTCWNSFHKGGCYIEPTDNISEEDKYFLEKIINKNKHGSIAEHLSYSFYIQGISRACLQELARHRIASLSVKSSRYTLKELKNELPFTWINGREEVRKRANKFIVLIGHWDVDRASILALENLRQILVSGVSNDIAKYCLPESYKTELTWTINARSLQNFLSLRTDKAALKEIRELAWRVYSALPDEHKYLFVDCLKEVVL